MLSNAYFVAKFRFDTAENEPAKNLQNFRKMHFSKMRFRKMRFRKMRFRKMHFPKMHLHEAERLGEVVRQALLLVQGERGWQGHRRGDCHDEG